MQAPECRSYLADVVVVCLDLSLSLFPVDAGLSTSWKLGRGHVCGVELSRQPASFTCQPNYTILSVYEYHSTVTRIPNMDTAVDSSSDAAKALDLSNIRFQLMCDINPASSIFHTDLKQPSGRHHNLPPNRARPIPSQCNHLQAQRCTDSRHIPEPPRLDAA